MFVISPCVRRTLLTVIGLLLLGSNKTAAQGQVKLYTDFASFQAAAPKLTTINFQTAITNGGVVQAYNTANGLTLSGVNFVGPVSNGDHRLGIANPAFFPVYSGFNGNPTVLSDGSNDDITFTRKTIITLPANTTAVGTNLYTITFGDFFNNTVTDVTFALSTGDTFTIHTFHKPTLAFAGFISNVPINSLTVTTPTNTSFPELSSFVFGPPASPAVPAPDVSGQVLVLRGLPRYIPGTTRFQQVLELRNISPTLLVGPLLLVVDFLSANATLLNPTGFTSLTTLPGLPISPYMMALPGGLAPGENVIIKLDFDDPTHRALFYGTRVLGGPGNP